MPKPSYFLISVSNRENLDLCIRYGLAGFPSSASGVWTFCEISDGDLISFLYGARAHNLYRVVQREAIRDARNLPPWRSLTFKESGRTYYFPFRIQLQPVRAFSEPLVRAEFSYVAENLLLRGGYRKTHFQADQTTLQSVSQMGTISGASLERLSLPRYTTFEPSFTRKPKRVSVPEVFGFRETILQAAIRQHFMDEAKLARLLEQLGMVTPAADTWEILSEKALPQGHIDLLLKQRVPVGSTLKIPMEVKLSRAQPKDVLQLREYVDELGTECPTSLLIASGFSREAVRRASNLGIKLVRYFLRVDLQRTATFSEVCQSLIFEPQ